MKNFFNLNLKPSQLNISNLNVSLWKLY